MSTTFFPTNTASSATSSSWTHSPTTKLLSLSRGAGAITVTDNTIASLNSSFQLLSNVGVWGSSTVETLIAPMDWLAGSLVFVSNPLNAVSIVANSAGTANLRGSESNAMANYVPGVGIWKLPAGGGATSFIGRFNSTTEYGTTETVESNSLFTHTSTVALADGDRIVIVFGHCGVGTSASGFTASGFYGGASGATGDVFVTLNETITEQVIPTQPYVDRQMPQLLAQ